MECAPFPIDLFPKLLTYMKIKDWIIILFSNKEVYSICRPIAVQTRAIYRLKPYLLRLQACFLARRTFVKRLEEEIGFRQKYLYIHEPRNGPTHICWRRVPPYCLTVSKSLKHLQRLIAADVERTNNFFMTFEPEQYQWLLDNVRIVDGILRVRI